jgi:hypothetical protein
MTAAGFFVLAAAALVYIGAELLPLRVVVRIVDRTSVRVRRLLRIRPRVGRIRLQRRAYPPLQDHPMLREGDSLRPVLANPDEAPPDWHRRALPPGREPLYLEAAVAVQDARRAEASAALTDEEFLARLDFTDLLDRWDADLAAWRAAWDDRLALTGRAA